MTPDNPSDSASENPTPRRSGPGESDGSLRLPPLPEDAAAETMPAGTEYNQSFINSNAGVPPMLDDWSTPGPAPSSSEADYRADQNAGNPDATSSDKPAQASLVHPHDPTHPDPLTGETGAHPVGVGLGALAAGSAATAAVFGAIGTVAGPVGTAVGAAVGAALGALSGAAAGKEIAESVNPTEGKSEPRS
jgi:hypothetical protein